MYNVARQYIATLHTLCTVQLNANLIPVGKGTWVHVFLTC